MSANGPQGRGTRHTRISASSTRFRPQHPGVAGLLCLMLVTGLLPSTAHAQESVLPVEQAAPPAEQTAIPVEQQAVPAETAAVPVEALVLPVGQQAVLARGTPLMTCTAGSQQETYNPPLKLSLQDITLTATGQLSSCVAFEQSGPISGQYTVSGAGTASCLTSSVATTSHITWSDGTTSTLEFGKGLDARQGGQAVSVIVGLVIQGRYEGSLAVGGFVLEEARNALHCLTEGIPSASGLSFLKLIQP
ncbi:hypothetical protein STIAU_3747 [Stigmatella aurantiaca DW4/3-1]|nr:hypothetical protein STIAU_3747 [Stigmatella aurantiaca DW4/3-1]